MILDNLDRHPCYAKLGPRFERAFGWFTGFGLQMPDGRYDIEGDKVFALVQSYRTLPAAEKQYEAHRAYVDIQYIAAGTEVIYYAPVDRLASATDYHFEKDYQLYRDPADSLALPLTAGQFVLFFPHDAHKPGCVSGAPGPVKKVVIKVRL